MIPRRLRLRNFLSYRDCTLDFTGLHVATLSGRNGNGKSALLDAITWALWGQARGRIEDDRIFHGESEMLVELDFEVSGDIFRVVRKRTRGRSAGALDCFQLDAQGRPRATSGGTMRETQAELDRRLHMDHTTFVNSAFLVQGHSNEFSTQTPAKRKEVLRKVLGLDRYEELAGHAHDRRRSTEVEAAAEERQIADGAPLLDAAPAVEADLAEVARKREAVGVSLREAEEEATALRLAAAEHDRRECAATEAEERLAEHNENVERRTAAIAALEGELATVTETLGRAPAIELAYRQLCDARDEDRSLARLAAEAAEIERTVTAAEYEIARERTRLETRLARLAEDRAAAVKLAGGLAALRAKETLVKEDRDRLAALDTDLHTAREEASEDQRRQAASDADARSYREQAQALKEREAALEEAEGAALCPVCRKPLSPQELHDTVAQYRRERRQLGEQYRAAQAAAKEAGAAAERGQERIAALQRERVALDSHLLARERDLSASLAEARKAERDIPELDDEIGELRGCIDGEAFAVEARARLANEGARLAALAYDRDAHAQAHERLMALEPAEPAFRELTRAQEQASGLGERIAQAREEQRRDAEARDASKAALAEARAALDASADVSARLAAAEDALAERKAQASALGERHGQLEERRAALDRLAARVEEAKGRLAAASDATRLHTELAQALGRNGVQAMLIEQSLPELERIANSLLDRMTDGRIQTALATQRANASGKTVETLDIRISDDLGTRDYEMYSGGEKFRVDFALRIALSRLLAARSGAALPTLIIDEGFGTQDEEGRDRLVEAINAISDDFRLILLVTHIEELRERFDRRIEVTKDAERGSQTRVV